MLNIADKIKEEIAKQAMNPQQRELLETMLGNMVSPKSQTTDWQTLTVVLCAAAMCVGKHPTNLRANEVRSTALMIARSLFDDDGNLITTSYKK